ncbi:hypothetical protein SNE40_009591 [Patella caerulea]|uniref:Uncharacterized protein n=1 Tax=Patella caerulea TaxID=87958 RepID=A0AAN8JRK4_PATCE
MKKPAAPKKTVTFRKFKDIDLASFKEDIMRSTLFKTPSDDIHALVEQYNTTLSENVDKHAPLKTSCFHPTEYHMVYRRNKTKKKCERRKAMDV